MKKRSFCYTPESWTPQRLICKKMYILVHFPNHSKIGHVPRRFSVKLIITEIDQRDAWGPPCSQLFVCSCHWSNQKHSPFSHLNLRFATPIQTVNKKSGVQVGNKLRREVYMVSKVVEFRFGKSCEKKNPFVGCLGCREGMKYYPVMWGLFHKPWNKDPYETTSIIGVSNLQVNKHIPRVFVAKI